MPVLHYVAVAAASIAAGLINAVAGGGTLVTFPTLTAVGLPSIVANVTNTVALSPGYLGGTLAQRDDLAGQGARLKRWIPSAVLGGLSGGVLLLVTSEALFRRIVPFLILLACAALAGQERIRAFVTAREGKHEGRASRFDVLAIYLAAVYGGYFGAGLGILLLAVLAVLVDDTLVRVNAAKQTLSLTINVTAALFFLFSGRVAWPFALTMALCSLVGGHVGGRIAKKLDPRVLRGLVIVVGVVVAGAYLAR